MRNILGLVNHTPPSSVVFSLDAGALALAIVVSEVLSGAGWVSTTSKAGANLGRSSFSSQIWSKLTGNEHTLVVAAAPAQETSGPKAVGWQHN